MVKKKKKENVTLSERVEVALVENSGQPVLTLVLDIE
jgi:hypothetical protein